MKKIANTLLVVFIIFITKQTLSIEKGKWSFVQDEDWCYIGSSPIESDLPETKIRKESFLNTLYNKLPWEDLLIGFQCKVLRNPNVYNVYFWNHFTNKYITSKHVRVNSDCNSCLKLIDYFDQNTYQTSNEKDLNL